MTRVAAIQKRLEAAVPDGNLFVANLPAPLHPALSMFLFHAPADIAYLLRLVELAAAMPEPLVHRSEPLPPWCAYCRWDNRHAPTCPWLLLQAALRALDGGAET